MQTRGLVLDFARPQPVVLADRSLAGWVVLGVAALFIIGSLIWYQILFSNIEDAQTRIEALRKPQPGPARAARGSSEAVAGEIKAVNQAIGRLGVPWGEMFRAVEEARSEHVVVLSLKPNLQRGEIRILGEADDFRAITGFVGELMAPGRLRHARLSTHEMRANGLVYFEVVGEWQGAR